MIPSNPASPYLWSYHFGILLAVSSLFNIRRLGVDEVKMELTLPEMDQIPGLILGIRF